jgi:hypothetical protein
MAKDAGYLELQRSELRHHAASHAQDDSKKLKYEQMVAIRDAVVTAPQLSAAMLRRNMEMHESPTKTIPAEHMRSFQHQVYRARKKLVDKQLKGFTLDDSYGKLQEFADLHLWSTLVRRHNDPEDDYHIGLHDFCVIGHQNEAALDVLRMNMSSLWMLTHAFRAIKAGWVSQKCKDCILPVQTAMCDNFKGWGNFAENVLGIKSNVCIAHATGNDQFFCAVECDR